MSQEYDEIREYQTERDNKTLEDINDIIQGSREWVAGDIYLSKLLDPLDVLLRSYGFAMSQGRDIIHSGDAGGTFKSVTGYFERASGESVKYLVETSMCSIGVEFELWDSEMDLLHMVCVSKSGYIRKDRDELENIVENDIKPALDKFLGTV